MQCSSRTEAIGFKKLFGTWSFSRIFWYSWCISTHRHNRMWPVLSQINMWMKFNTLPIQKSICRMIAAATAYMTTTLCLMVTDISDDTQTFQIDKWNCGWTNNLASEDLFRLRVYGCMILIAPSYGSRSKCFRSYIWRQIRRRQCRKLQSANNHKFITSAREYANADESSSK